MNIHSEKFKNGQYSKDVNLNIVMPANKEPENPSKR